MRLRGLSARRQGRTARDARAPIYNNTVEIFCPLCGSIYGSKKIEGKRGAWKGPGAMRPFPPTGGKSSRKEVFQPHLPVRLPCYDLALVTDLALGRSLR